MRSKPPPGAVELLVEIAAAVDLDLQGVDIAWALRDARRYGRPQTFVETS
jgi:hypothetical protein